ncbi:MAG: YceK/YidQ family lipoprotein [Planctomycetes bacterium]|nr:YceK/YidQ family lipoprotein [Planctomycetota bacterium]
MRRAGLALAAAAVLLGGSGCMTAGAQYFYWAEEDFDALECMAYGGVQGDWAIATEGICCRGKPGWCEILIACADFPLSLAADTALLPLTIGQTIALAVSRSGEAPSAEEVDR